MDSQPPLPPDGSEDDIIKQALNKAVSDYLRLKQSEKAVNEQLAAWVQETGKELGEHAARHAEIKLQESNKHLQSELQRINIFYSIAVVTLLVLTGAVFIYYIQSEVHQSEIRVEHLSTQERNDVINNTVTIPRNEYEQTRRRIQALEGEIMALKKKPCK